MQLADYAEKYTTKLKQWIKPLFIEKPPTLSTERLCLSIDSKEIHAIRLNKTQTVTTLLANENLRYDEAGSIPPILGGLINRLSDATTPIYWLLAPEDYQVFLIDALPVEKNEFYAALRWRARGLINYPVDEAVIDAFPLPPKKSSASSMIAAVIAKKERLTAIIDLLKQSEVKPSIIDIPEFAMRNLTALYEEDEKSSAFIYFYDKVVILNITRQKNLFFTRHIPIPKKSLTSGEPDYEQLSLDLLRYFDYYQSQWRHPSPNRIFTAANNQDNDLIASKLSDCMRMTVNPFQIKTVTGNADDLLRAEKSNLLVLGCALREDKRDAKTGN